MFDLEKFCKDYNIQYWTYGKNVSPGWVNVSCPYHEDSNHLGFSPEGKFHCWKCGGHHAVSVIRNILSIDERQAKQILNQYKTHRSNVSKLNNKIINENFSVKIELPGSRLGKFHKRYLASRGFDPDVIETKYKVTGTGPCARWAGFDFALRIIIPIYENGILISFQARDITNKQKLRYKGCPIEKSRKHYKKTLYNIDNCPGRSIRLVEGITDVWRMGDGYAATFGISMTDHQVSLLSRYDRIFFVFDPEPEAQQKAKKVAEKLCAIGKDVELIELDFRGDPGDLSDSQAKELRKLLA